MPAVDFAILTGLVEELQAVLRVFPEAEEVSKNADVWYRTRVRANNGENYEVVAAYQTGMGPLSAHDLTAKVIDHWDPAYVILVGIAGSFNKDVKLGDVIVSQQVFYYDQGKATAEGIRYRPEGYPCSAVLVRQAEALQLDQKALNSWLTTASESATRMAEEVGADGGNKARVRLAEVLRGYRPATHFGTVASGSLVVADKKKQEELLLLHGKIIGTEMEGAGVLHATFAREVPTPAVVIKGISDAADKDKDLVDDVGCWRELAKETPARLLLEMIRRGRIRPTRADQFSLDPTPGSAGEAHGAGATRPCVSLFPALAARTLTVPKPRNAVIHRVHR